MGIRLAAHRVENSTYTVMQNFTSYGQGLINEIGQRYNISSDAVICMLYAVQNGGGTMAQFNCPELGGGGQWMSGGMTMVGDMFNNGLKNTVDNLCNELSNLLANEYSAIFKTVKKSAAAPNSMYFPNGGSGNWWPDWANLGMASSTGGQNNIRYAVFPQSRRLAVEANGKVTVYDTLDNQIGGVSQQQGGDASLTFSSQYGVIQVSSLPIVSDPGLASTSQNNFVPPANPPAPVYPPFQNDPIPTPNYSENQSTSPVSNNFDQGLEEDIFAKIEKLAGLRDRGFVTEEEFSKKKMELMDRL